MTTLLLCITYFFQCVVLPISINIVNSNLDKLLSIARDLEAVEKQTTVIDTKSADFQGHTKRHEFINIKQKVDNLSRNPKGENKISNNSEISQKARNSKFNANYECIKCGKANHSPHDIK